MPDVDYELPTLAPSGHGDDDDDLIVELFRHTHGPRHRLRDDIALNRKGEIVQRGGFTLVLRDAAIIVVIALVISVIIKTFFLRPFYIPSASMHNTLIEEDRVLVNQLVPDLVPLNRGDVIVFQDPGGWLPAAQPEEKQPVQAVVDGFLEGIGLKPEDAHNHLVKRVIGMPGDHVACCNAYGQIVINDVPIREPYIVTDSRDRASGETFDVTVPEDSVWVMGDNRFNSQDSRAHQDLPTKGFVPYENIVGQAFMINWPMNRIGFIDNYSGVFAAVPSRRP